MNLRPLSGSWHLDVRSGQTGIKGYEPTTEVSQRNHTLLQFAASYPPDARRYDMWCNIDDGCVYHRWSKIDTRVVGWEKCCLVSVWFGSAVARYFLSVKIFRYTQVKWSKCTIFWCSYTGKTEVQNIVIYYGGNDRIPLYKGLRIRRSVLCFIFSLNWNCISFSFIFCYQMRLVFPGRQECV